MLRIYPLTSALLSLGRPILVDREGELERVAIYVDGEEDLERFERSDVGDINHRNDQTSRGSTEEANHIEKSFHVEFWILFDFLTIVCYILLR